MITLNTTLDIIVPFTDLLLDHHTEVTLVIDFDPKLTLETMQFQNTPLILEFFKDQEILCIIDLAHTQIRETKSMLNNHKHQMYTSTMLRKWQMDYHQQIGSIHYTHKFHNKQCYRLRL